MLALWDVFRHTEAQYKTGRMPLAAPWKKDSEAMNVCIYKVWYLKGEKERGRNNPTD